MGGSVHEFGIACSRDYEALADAWDLTNDKAEPEITTNDLDKLYDRMGAMMKEGKFNGS